MVESFPLKLNRMHSGGIGTLSYMSPEQMKGFFIFLIYLWV